MTVKAHEANRTSVTTVIHPVPELLLPDDELDELTDEDEDTEGELPEEDEDELLELSKISDAEDEDGDDDCELDDRD